MEDRGLPSWLTKLNSQPVHMLQGGGAGPEASALCSGVPVSKLPHGSATWSRWDTTCPECKAKLSGSIGA